MFQQAMSTARSLVADREGQCQHRDIGWAFLGSAPPVDTKPSTARAPSLQHTQLCTGSQVKRLRAALGSSGCSGTGTQFLLDS